MKECSTCGECTPGAVMLRGAWYCSGPCAEDAARELVNELAEAEERTWGARNRAAVDGIYRVVGEHVDIDGNDEPTPTQIASIMDGLEALDRWLALPFVEDAKPNTLADAQGEALRLAADIPGALAKVGNDRRAWALLGTLKSALAAVMDGSLTRAHVDPLALIARRDERIGPWVAFLMRCLDLQGGPKRAKTGPAYDLDKDPARWSLAEIAAFERDYAWCAGRFEAWRALATCVIPERVEPNQADPNRPETWGR